MEYLLGIDIGGTHVKGGIVTGTTGKMDQRTIVYEKIDAGGSATSIIKGILRVITALKKGRSENEWRGIGIAIPGPFDYTRGIAAIHGVRKFDALFGLDLKEEIKRVCSLPVVFLNDASAYALGEYYGGAAQGSERSMVVTVGTGLGSTFMAREEILDETTPAVPEHGYLYNIPFRDSIADDYFSTRWFVTNWNHRFPDKAVMDVKTLAEYAYRGEQAAKVLFEEFADHFTGFIAPFLRHFCPDCLVLGGNIMRGADLFLERIKSELETQGIGVRIDTCRLWEDAPLIGAAMYANQVLGRSGMEEEAVKRNTKQYLAPMKAQATPRGVYDLYPAFPVGENKIRSGIGCLADWIERHGQVVIDGYGGVFWDELVSELGDEFRRRGKCVRWFRTDVAMRDARTLEEMLAPDLGGEDPLFGRMTERQLRDWFDPGKLNAFRPDQEADINVLIGIGAALAGWKAPLIYVDVPKNEIQFRMRAGWVKNLGMNKPKNNQQTYKHFFFVDWVVLNRHKAECLPQIELIVDEQRRGQQLLMMSGEDLREGLHRMGRNFFRVRPWFEPGAWGGQWMKQHIPGLNEEVPNLAWSFELMVLENGLMFESNGYRLEVSFDFLMYNDYRQVLGESADVFKTDFPIRFVFLDTFDGGNLSVQCHPRTTYIREQFNMPFTQDETYYILDSRQNPQVYLGFQENIRPEEFGEVLKQSQAEGKTIDIEKYVQKFPAHKHDLFLIPNGTVHASGKNCMVLEISSAPYIFTFKMYDWLRLDLNGKPRPLNVQRGMDNLYFERKGERVVKELVCHPEVLEKNEHYTLEHLPTHEKHFYDVHRYTVEDAVEVETEGSCQVWMVVEGKAVRVETREGMRQRFNYAETFVIPAAAATYRIINETPGEKVILVKAFIKKGYGFE